MNIPKLAEYLTDIDSGYILEAAEKEDSMANSGRIKLRRAVIIAAACVCLILLMAAGRTLFDSEKYLREYDVDPSYMIQDKMITSDGEGHYFGVIMCGNGFRLMGSDGSDGENAYNICDVPGCDHTDNKICLALSRPEFTGLSVYDGRLYWTSRQKGVDYAEALETVNIMSSNLDGSDIRLERKAPGEVFSDTVYNKYIRVHRGYMYFIGFKEPETVFDPDTLTSHQKDPDETPSLNVYAEELREDGTSEKIFGYSCENRRFYSYTSQFYANNLYIMIRSDSTDGSGFRFEVFKVDLKTGGSKRVYSTDKYDINGWWLDGSENLYYTETDPETNSTSLMRLDINRGKPKKTLKLPEMSIYRVINGRAVGLDGNAHKLDVVEFDGSVTELDFDDLAKLVEEEYGYAGISLCGVDNENVILQMCDDECFALIPLDGSEPRIIIASCYSDTEFERLWGGE